MDEVKNEVVRQWFHKAENDLQNIRNNLAAKEVPTDTICFHAQQAIEKVLKAVLVAQGRNVSKTHDLVRLLTEVLEFIPELSSFEDRLEEISEYGVAVRYPNGFSEPSLEEAVSAYETAQQVKTTALLKIDL
ncbi:MAG TPA: DNA-binding protein [Geobacter sp.]|nr:DNA-binding protein [Geobacter sp.]